MDDTIHVGFDFTAEDFAPRGKHALDTHHLGITEHERPFAETGRGLL